jgi:phage terminase small subunit
MATRKAAPKKRPAAVKKVVRRNKPGTSKEAADTRKRLFVEAFLVNGENGTDAAITAGFSAHTAASQASRLLKDVKVQAAIKERRDALLSKLELTTEAVLRSLAQAVFFDPRKLYRADGSLKDVHEMDDDTAMALAGLEVTEDYATAPLETELERQAHGGELKRQRGAKVLASRTAKVKWHDKTSAREQAMKHLGLFKADNTQRTLLGDVPRDKLKAIVARLAGG